MLSCLATHLHLVQRLRIGEAIPWFPQQFLLVHLICVVLWTWKISQGPSNVYVTSKYAVQMEVAGFPKYRYLPTNPTMWYYITEIHNFKHIDSMVVVWQFASHLWVQKCHLGLIWFRWYHVGLWFTAVINNDFCFGTQLMCCRYGTYSFISLKVLDILIFHMCGINILGFHRSICSEVWMRVSSNSVTRSCQILLGWLHEGEWEGQGVWYTWVILNL